MCVLWVFDLVVFYVYYMLNEIIYGVEFYDIFEVGDVLLVVDMFFNIFFVLLDVLCFGLIYVGV